MRGPFKKKLIILNNNSGMALLVVLAVISVLLVAALNLARTTGESALVTCHSTDIFIAKEQAMAGIHLAMALLAEDAATSEIDSLQEKWARTEKLAFAVEAMGYEKDSLVVEIKDELAKIQVNSLIKQHPGRELNPDQYRVWENFFGQFSKEPIALVNCLEDWLDHRDDEAVTGLSGAESDYYLSLDKPYTCANGPLTHISEFFLIKGVGPETFEPDSIKIDDTDVKKVVLEELITVHGLDTNLLTQSRYSYSGKININTAPELVIRALLPQSAVDQAKDLVAFREEQAESGDVFTNILDKGWVAQIIDLSDKEKLVFDRLVRYKSDLFNVRSQSTVNQARNSISALIHRTKDKKSGKWSCRILEVQKDN